VTIRAPWVSGRTPTLQKHLWQTRDLVGMALLLMLALRKNLAKARYRTSIGATALQAVAVLITNAPDPQVRTHAEVRR